MIAAEQVHLIWVLHLERHQQEHALETVGPAVDVVSQSDDKIIGSWLDDIEQGSEGSEASVNISNGDSHDANARSWNGIWKEQYFETMIQMKMGAWSRGECVFDSTGKLADRG